MYRFIFKIAKYVFLLFFLFLCKFISVKFIAFNNRAESHNLKLNTRVVFFGDSHFEVGIKESDGIQNLSKSAQPLFFSCVQAQQYSNLDRNFNIVLSFDNLSLFHHLKIENGSNYFLNKYFPHMSTEDHFSFFFDYPGKWLNVFLGLGKESQPGLEEDTGFYPRKADGKLHQPINIIGQTSDDEINDDLNIQRLLKFIRDNKHRKICLLRMPMLITQEQENNFTVTEKQLQSFLNRVTAENENVKFIDLKDACDNNSNLFYDWDHLNSDGADSLNLKIKQIFNLQ